MTVVSRGSKQKLSRTVSAKRVFVVRLQVRPDHHNAAEQLQPGAAGIKFAKGDQRLLKPQKQSSRFRLDALYVTLGRSRSQSRFKAAAQPGAAGVN